MSGAFGDVDISNDGAKAVVSGSGIVWILNSANGSIISQKVVKVLNSGSASPLSWKSYKETLILSS